MSAERAAFDLDALIEQARAEKPVPLRSMDARRMVRSAVEEALTSRKTRTRRVAMAFAAVILLGFGLSSLVLFSERVTSVEVRRGDRPLRLALRSGDTLVAAPATQLSILAQEPAKRMVRVGYGTALFDVRSLRDGERFEVETAHANLRVLGTVFAVEVENGRTTVRVYEGRVYVSGRVIRAGGVWVSVGDSPKFAGGALSVEAVEAVEARKLHASAQSDAPPVATPQVIPVPITAPTHEPPAVQVAPLPALEGQVSLEQAQKALAEGDAEGALAQADSHGSAGDGSWLLLSADALHALGRFAAASQRYQAAAQVLPDERREKAALTAASLALLHERDAGRALTVLDTFDLDGDRSSVRERASVLRVDALLALEQPEAAAVHALRYLGREPETQTSARMRSLLK